MRRSPAPLLVGLIALLFSSVVVSRALADADWNPTLFTAFGEKAIPTRTYAEERLDDVFLRPEQGHDGKFYFVQANDPWLLDPEENASVLDRPLYRSQRMLYPVLVSGGGFLGPQTIVWSMMIVNLLAVGAGSWAVARIATELRATAWWGLAFGLNIGFMSEINIGGAGVVAAACAFGAVLFVMRHRLPAAVVLLALAALAREAMLIVALGTALWLWSREERRDAVAPLVVPVFAVLAWAVYVRTRIGSVAVTPKVEEIGWPFVGLIEAFRSWLANPFNLVAGVAVVCVILLFARRVMTTPHVVGWAFAGFVLLATLFTEQVWHSFFDITRAIAPIITAFIVMVFVVGRHPTKPQELGSTAAGVLG